MTPMITFTEAAIQHIKENLDKNKKAIGFRLSLKKTGCSGYAYVPKLIESVINSDIHFMTPDHLAVYIDPACESFVKGIVVDCVIDTTSLKQKKLIFINPNEKNRCGCGESFTIE